MKNYWVLLAPPLLAGFAIAAGGEFVSILIFSLLWACLAASYDLFSGYSGRINMGYAMFPGLGGYATAYLNVMLGLPIWVSSSIALLFVLLVALLFGWATLRIQGIYFALATSIFPLVLIGLTNVFAKQFGGEDGLHGVAPLPGGEIYNLIIVVIISMIILGFALWCSNNKIGLVLKAIRAGELTAETLGWNSQKVLIIMFVVSGGLGGFLGITLTHYQMIVTHDLLFVTATLTIIMLAQAGGMGTVIGPFIAGIFIIFFESSLQAWSSYRSLIFFGMLVVILRFLPNGLAGLIGKLRVLLANRMDRPSLRPDPPRL